MIYLLRDDLFGAERLNEIRARLGPPELQGLNTTVLDGSRLTVGELRAAVAVVPFLAARRLVIVRRLFGGRRADGAGEATAGGRRASRGDARMQDILDYLPTVPAETDLVFIEDEAFDRDHPVVRQITRLGGEVYLPDPPRWEHLVPWIVQRVRAKGGADRARGGRSAGRAGGGRRSSPSRSHPGSADHVCGGEGHRSGRCPDPGR